MLARYNLNDPLLPFFSFFIIIVSYCKVRGLILQLSLTIEARRRSMSTLSGFHVNFSKT